MKSSLLSLLIGVKLSTELEQKNNFIQDTENILDRLNTLLTGDQLSISKIYREVHSLKGAAGFAGLYNMENMAHNFEDLLNAIKNGHVPLSDETEQIFYHIQNYFIKNTAKWKSEGAELQPDDLLGLVKEKTLKNEPIDIEVVDDNPAEDSFFNDFEQELLKEAMLRGDQFYKIVCHIDREEEMKYPRLFLVVNNLEKISNVIKINPSLEEITQNRSREITLFLTTDKVKSEIYRALSLDRIREVEFLRMDFNSFFSEALLQDKKQDRSLYGRTIDVETKKIEEIFNYAQDLHNKLLIDDIVIPEKKEVVEKLLTGMKNSLTTLTMISCNEAFSDFKSYCNRLGTEFGKRVNFVIEGGEITLERSLAQTLKELLIQLIKNSVDHGIEKSELRKKLGKDPVGVVVLKISRVKNCLVLKFSDDGAGIDKSKILKRGIEGRFIDDKEEISLLSLLSRPGFSTSMDINHYSGRGIGLDIVVNRVINKLDGKIKVESSVGKGVTFDIVVPPTSLVKKFTIFKYRNRSYGFTKINVLKRITLKRELVSKGENSALNYSYDGELYPIYTPLGRLSSNQTELKEKYGLIVRYLGKKAFIPVEEFIVEKEFFSSVISYINSDSPNHKYIKVGNKKEDFIYILPSIINF